MTPNESVIKEAARLLGLPLEDVRLEMKPYDPYVSNDEPVYRIAARQRWPSCKEPVWSVVASGRFGYWVPLEELKKKCGGKVVVT